MIQAAMHHAATRSHSTPSHQQGLVLCHFYYHYDCRLRLSALQHTSSPRTRTPEFIYFISGGGCCTAATATGVQRAARKIAASQWHNLDAGALCGLSQMEICRQPRSRGEKIQPPCSMKSFPCFRICWKFIPGREILVFASPAVQNVIRAVCSSLFLCDHNNLIKDSCPFTESLHRDPIFA